MFRDKQGRQGKRDSIDAQTCLISQMSDTSLSDQRGRNDGELYVRTQQRQEQQHEHLHQLSISSGVGDLRACGSGSMGVLLCRVFKVGEKQYSLLANFLL